MLDVHARQLLAQLAIKGFLKANGNSVARVDIANQARMLQRQVREQVALDENSILVEARNLLKRFDQSRLNKVSLRPRLESIIHQLEQMDVRWLTHLQYDLQDLTLEFASASSRAADLQRMQQHVLDELEAIVGDLRKAAAANDRIEDLVSIIQTQRRLGEDTSTLWQQTISRQSRNLSSELRARLDEVATAQSLLARRVEVLGSTFVEQRAEAQTIDPGVLMAARQLAEYGISTMMRESAEDLQGNRLGRAEQLQSRIVDYLSEIHARMVAHQTDSESAGESWELQEWITRQSDLVDRTVSELKGGQRRLPQLAAEQTTLATDVEQGTRGSSRPLTTWIARKCVSVMRVPPVK